jgi:hypothetical protein
MSPTPGILFRIDPKSSRQLREWIEEIDWQYIKHCIERGGKCMVKKIHHTPGERYINIIDTMPEKPGIYHPKTADVGGETIYRFRSQANAAVLNAQVLYGIPDVAEQPARSITLAQPLEHRLEAGDFDILYVKEIRFTDSENLFGFTGEFFDIFRAWERYGPNAEDFEFVFQPLTIGCVVWVIHVESGESIHLTANVDW